MTKSASYDPNACCGADCWALDDKPDEPCWGKVHVADEIDDGDGDWSWVHECEGHDGCSEGGKYKLEGCENGDR